MKLNAEYFMSLAFEQAGVARACNEVPVGAVIVRDDMVLGVGHNMVIQKNSVTSHAEINAINQASTKLNNYRLVDCDLYVTLEPCHMCAKAIVDARINFVYFAAYEPKTGAIQSIDQFFDRKDLNHKVNFKGGLMSSQSSELLKNFFQKRRC